MAEGKLVPPAKRSRRKRKRNREIWWKTEKGSKQKKGSRESNYERGKQRREEKNGRQSIIGVRVFHHRVIINQSY
jgi:hypothetical protein